MSLQIPASSTELLYRIGGTIPDYNSTYSVMLRVYIVTDQDTYSHFYALTNSITGESGDYHNSDYIGTDADGTTTSAYAYSGGSGSSTGTQAYPTGAWHSVGLVRRSDTDLEFYYDGVRVASDSTQDVSARGAVGAEWINHLNGGFPGNIRVEGYKSWNVALSESEMATEHSYMNAVRSSGLINETRMTASTVATAVLSEVGDDWNYTGGITYSASTSGAPIFSGGVTLTAATGNFTLTGVAAALRKDYILQASTGSFALTGNNATLNYSGSPPSTYTLSCSVGQFILNGQPATLTYSVPNYWTWDRVTGNEGYRIEWGQTSGGPYPNSSDNVTNDETITLVLPYRTTWYARVAALVGGTPQDWSEEKVFTSGIPDLNADVGTFTLTGNGANLLRGYTLTASTGAFTLTGNNTNLRIQRTLPAATGSFTLTGNDVNLNKVTSGTYTLVAETGSFALTGVSANLLYNRTLLANVGSFTLTGINTGLLYSNAPVSQYKHRQLHVCMSISL